MKKVFLWLLVVSLVAVFSLVGCNKEAPAEEVAATTAAAETTATATTVAEEIPTKEFTLRIISHFGESETLEKVMDTLDGEFESAHPGLTIQRDYMEFREWAAISQLRLTSENPPDLFDANLGESGMGLMIRAGLLLNLTPYAEKFGWFDKINQRALNVMSYTADGKQFGEGNVYGMAPTVDYIGVFYNKQKFSEAGVEVPKTYEEFISLIEKFKEKGETPLILGGIEGWPTNQIYVEILYSLLDREDQQWGDDWVFARNNVSYIRPETVQAAAEFVKWVEKGYFIDGFEGISYSDSQALFAGGEGAMYIGGSWITSSIKDYTDVNKFGFFTVPPREGKDWKMTTACLSMPLAIHVKTLYPKVAAEYLDWFISPRAAELWQEVGNAPTLPDLSKVKEGTMSFDILNEWNKTMKNGEIGNYQDMASPTMFDTQSAAIQELLAKKITPEEYVQKIDEDYQAFLAGRQQK